MANDVNTGRVRSPYAVAITNPAFDSTDDPDYQNTRTPIPNNGTFKVPTTLHQSNGGMINRAFDSDEVGPGSKPRPENGNFQVQQKTSTPRKKANAVYEPMDAANFGSRAQTGSAAQSLPANRVEREPSVVSEGFSGESCVARLVLFFILLLAVLTLVLVLLIMLGKIGPNSDCSCGEGPVTGSLVASVGASDTELILAEIEAMRRNASEIHRRLEQRKKKILELQSEIARHQNEYNSTINGIKIRDAQVRNEMEVANTSWNEVEANITSQNDNLVLELRADHNAMASNLGDMNNTWRNTRNNLEDEVNTIRMKLLTFEQEVNNVNGSNIIKDEALRKTIEHMIADSNSVNISLRQQAHDSFQQIIEILNKVNSTLLAADSQIANSLSIIRALVETGNSTLKEKVDSVKLDLQTKDSTLESDLRSANSTLTVQVDAKEQTQGAPGPQGYRGPPGLPGPTGDQGTKGPGDLSTCTRDSKQFAAKVALVISSEVPSTKVVMSVSCSGLDEGITSYLTVTGNPPTEYECNCFNPVSNSADFCVIHYWLCSK